MINRVVLVGNVGKDPEFHQFGSGVCNFTLATTKKWKAKDGTPKTETTWHRIAAWGKLGKDCQESVRKGDLVYVSGSIKIKKYTDKNGAQQMSFDIEAEEVQVQSPNDQPSQAEQILGELPHQDEQTPVDVPI